MTIRNDEDIIVIRNEDNDHQDVNRQQFPILFERPIKKRFRSSASYYQNHHPYRLILKSVGHPAVTRLQRNWLPIIYCHDVANTLLTSKWRWSLLALCMSLLLTWLGFAWLWWMITAYNTDFDNIPSNLNNNTAALCLNGIGSFAGHFLFSIETQSTIGYGNRYITHHCPEAIILLCLQLLLGSLAGGLMVQCVYQKMQVVRHPPSMWCFSENAIICQRDSEFCLIFRVRDPTGRYQCQNKITAHLIHPKKHENSTITIKSIKLEQSGLLIWPIEVVHIINETSPFWDLSAKDLITKRFELIVSMEGTSYSTSRPSSTATSYINSEILWGRRFNTSCVRFDKTTEMYIVDHGLFNSTIEIEAMPLCSPKRLQQVLDEMTSLMADIASSGSPSSPEPSSSNRTDSGIGSFNVSPVIVHHPAMMRGINRNEAGNHWQEVALVDKDEEKNKAAAEKIEVLLDSLHLKEEKVDGNKKAMYKETAL